MPELVHMNPGFFTWCPGSLVINAQPRNVILQHVCVTLSAQILEIHAWLVIFWGSVRGTYNSGSIECQVLVKHEKVPTHFNKFKFNENW
jgi:hypothetical protein